MPLIDLDHTEFVYEPFPMGLARPVFAPDLYERLVDAFPRPEQCPPRPEQGKKSGLSEYNDPKEFRRFVSSNEVWRDVHAELRSEEFRARLLKQLLKAGIDLSLLRERRGLRRRFGTARDAWQRRYIPPRRPRLRGTMEFSMMPAAGGHIVPHTDATDKVITLVFSMMRPGEWDEAWGGGTDMLRATDPRRSYNYVNRYMGFDEVEVLHTFPFQPNQAVVFVKTFNSLHCVRPMTGPEGVMRRTLTVNQRRVY